MRLRPRILPVFLAFALAGCEDGVSPADRSQLSLSVTVYSLASTSQASFGSSELTLSDGVNTLILTEVALVLREIELERQFHADCDDPGRGQSEDDCEKFEVGPLLLQLPLDASVEQVLTIEPDPDIYDELEFDIHKPDDDTPEDIQFLLAHPDFDGVSIRAMGSFNGADFVFLQDLNEEQERDLAPPLIVAEGQAELNLTLVLDVASWFRFPGTDDLIDPATANKGGANENLVEETIRGSIDVFDDDDRDGHR